MHDGKLMLSMDDAVALALENNLDIAIARYNLNIADTDVLRAKAGAAILGVIAGIVQNTPGGGVGGLGGTSSAPELAAPASAREAPAQDLNGLVGSTLGHWSADHQLRSHLHRHAADGPLQFSCDQRISACPGAGTEHQTAISPTRRAFNLAPICRSDSTTAGSPATTHSPQFSPSLNSGFKLQLTQHLLQGSGFAPNNRFIRIAKNNREITDVAFRLQTITTVDQIENMYWDLVFAYENVRVQQESLAFAQKTLSDTQKQVQIGSLAPIEVVRAQSTVATDQQSLIQCAELTFSCSNC